MENVSTDNVLGRLYNIISSLKKTQYASLPNTEHAFSKVFSIEVNNTALIYQSYAELFKMCLIGIEEIKKLQPKNCQKYINTLNEVISGLSKIYFNSSSNVMNNGMEKFVSYFDEVKMSSLENCADYLSEHTSEELIEEEKLQQLVKDLEELIEYVYSCNLNTELRNIIIAQLNSTRESLLKYKLFGTEGIRNSMASTVGTLVLNKNEIKDNNLALEIIKNVFTVMGKINTVISAKKNAANLLSGIFTAITNNDKQE
jgi:hypothetical protein